MSKNAASVLGGNALAPIFLSDPVADFSLARLFPANDVASDLPIVEDGLRSNCLVAHNLVGPVRHEGFPFPGRESGHLVGVRVKLVFEENGEVCFPHILAKEHRFSSEFSNRP